VSAVYFIRVKPAKGRMEPQRSGENLNCSWLGAELTNPAFGLILLLSSSLWLKIVFVTLGGLGGSLSAVIRESSLSCT
jgi:hypothetical protein